MITVEHLSGLGGAIRELRLEARLKQIEVCRRIGMTAPQVSRYENARETPSLESLVKILQAIGADLCDLQRVLVAQAEPVEAESAAAPGEATPGEATPGEATPGEATPGKATPGEATPGEATPDDPAIAARVAEVAVGEARDEGDRRIEGSPGLRHVVSGLVELNIEGLERLERRLQALEQRLARGGM